MIPYGRQDIAEEDIKSVIEVLKSDYLTQGPAIARFEEQTAAYCGAKHGIAVSSATAALHVACLAAGVGPGDLVWTSPISFVASANCALYCGASIDFVDILPQTVNIDPPALEQKLISAKKQNRIPKVLVVVHFGGASCDMQAIEKITKPYGILIIEDASHAVGGSYQKSRVGSCQHSAMTVFSFHPVKIITSGEGGMIMTNSAELKEKLMRFRSHGITRNPALMTEPTHGPWYYQQIDLGFNYRITDIQAALGSSQLRRIDGFVQRRNALANRYKEALKSLPVTFQNVPADVYSAYHIFVIGLTAEGEKTISRQELFDDLRRAGIEVNVHYIPIHLQPFYRRLGFKEGMFPKAESYYQSAITLPLFVGLTEANQDKIIEAVSRPFSTKNLV